MNLLDKLKETSDMLQYAHTTSEVYYDYEMVSKFIKDLNKYLKDFEEN